MSRADLDVAVEWAAAEGWNPGVEDAEAFYAIDPGGFLMGWLGSVPVAAISVVRHSPAYGFLGFYLCDPAFRGQGHGLALWQAGMAHLGDCTVGLDGVVAQQQNYRRSGFRLAHQTQRYEGKVAGCKHPGVEPAGSGDLPALLALDHAIQGGAREAYMTEWFKQTQTRQTLVMRGVGRIIAAGTIRACRSGHKVAPLYAPDIESACALVESLVVLAGAGRIAIDVPDPNTPGVSLVGRFGLRPSFACARMYNGDLPDRDVGRIFAETSFELG